LIRFVSQTTMNKENQGSLPLNTNLVQEDYLSVNVSRDKQRLNQQHKTL